MRAPYGLNILDKCLTCPVREEHLFCNLPVPALQKLNEIKSTAMYPMTGAVNAGLGRYRDAREFYGQVFLAT